MVDAEEKKRRAADASLAYVKDGMVLGLGTGSTARHVLEGLARKVAEGWRLSGVPTSLATAEAAKMLGIPLTSLEDHPALDLAIDGADEVDPKLDLIKGLGGALFREKIVAAASKKFVVVVDDSKLVKRLGLRSPVPVEVHPFGWRTAIAALERLGAEVTLRVRDGVPFRTDNGNHILDARFRSIPSPKKLAQDLDAVPATVGHGLFLAMADAAVVGTDKGVKTLRPTRRS